MTKNEFTSKISEYWTRTPDAVVDEIASVVYHAPAPALAAVYGYLRKHTEPNKMLGVVHVHQAAEATGSALSPRVSRAFDLKCTACDATWNYQQGVRDTCPHCGMEGIWILNHKEYRHPGGTPDEVPVPKSWAIAYNAMIDKCRRRMK